MTYKIDKLKLKLPKHLDRRVSLTKQDKQNIINEYNTTDISTYKLADKYNISRRMIQFILYPERLQKAREQFKERRKDGRYYNLEKHTAAMRSLRLHRAIVFGVKRRGNSKSYA